jgi:hypothetical protein
MFRRLASLSSQVVHPLVVPPIGIGAEQLARVSSLVVGVRAKVATGVDNAPPFIVGCRVSRHGNRTALAMHSASLKREIKMQPLGESVRRLRHCPGV